MIESKIVKDNDIKDYKLILENETVISRFKNVEDQLKGKEILEEFNEFFLNEFIEKIAHNLKFDLKVISTYGIEVKGALFDTMIAQYLINPESKQSMDFLATYYLNYQPVSIETLLGKKGKNQGNMSDLTPEQIKDYACEDADITLRLWKLLSNDSVVVLLF